MQVKRVAISELKGANYNPKSRTAAGPHLSQLVKSIETHGLHYPILVSKEMRVIDGHRRLAACKALGWDAIPILVCTSDNTDLVYAEVNANSRHLTGNQTLTIWLKSPSAVTARAVKMFERACEVLGRDLLEVIANKGFSLRIYRVAAKLADYVDAEDDAVFIRKAVRWMMKHRNAHLVRSYIDMQQAPGVLFKAVKSGSDMRMSFSASAK